MLVPHTPRSSFESPRHHTTGFLDLPTEIRLDIYKLILADLPRRPYRLEYRPRTGFRVRHSKNLKAHPLPRLAHLLLVNKLIHAEASDVLHDLQDGVVISFRYVSRPVPEILSARVPCVPDDWQSKYVPVYDLHDPRDSLWHVLRSVRGPLTIKVDMTRDLVGQAVTGAFVRWMRAVFNASHPEGGKELRVGFTGFSEAVSNVWYGAWFEGWRVQRTVRLGNWVRQEGVEKEVAMLDEKAAWKAYEFLWRLDRERAGEVRVWERLFKRNFVFQVATLTGT